MVAYGWIAPRENAGRGHRAIAQRLDATTADGSSIAFFNEIDEGLWFYAQGFELLPVPGTQPRYNTSFDLAENFRFKRRHDETLADLEARCLVLDKRALLDWLDRADLSGRYVLIRSRYYDLFAADLVGRASPLFREIGMKCNELVLLKVSNTLRQTTTAAAEPPVAR